MKKIISIFTLVLLLSLPSFTHALDSRVESIYESFLTKIENTYSPQKVESILYSVQERVSDILNTNFSPEKRQIIKVLDALNNEALFDIWQKWELSQADQIAYESSQNPSNNLIPYSRLSREFAGYITPDHPFLLEDVYYYGYNFSSFRFYEDKYGVSNRSLENSGFSRDNEIVFRNEDGIYNFVQDYEKHRLVSASDVFGLPNKKQILAELSNDAKFQTPNMEEYFSQIADTARSLSAGKTRDEAIDAIYAWILENISYSQGFSLSDEEIFSGIETFRNKQWVCTWYTKLMSYMLSFAWVQDVEVIRWHVIDARDFPQIGHAWIRIGDRYYDPTFDDPVWATSTKTRDEYKYFGLPKDIFYANRFEYDDLPEWFENKTEWEITDHIFNNLRSLKPKYEWLEAYSNIFSEISFHEDYNISPRTTITPELLAEKIWYYNVENNSFRYLKDWVNKRITSIKFYLLDDENTKRVLDIFWYDTASFTLFNWQTESWTREWRLGYEITEQ